MDVTRPPALPAAPLPIDGMQTALVRFLGRCTSRTAILLVADALDEAIRELTAAGQPTDRIKAMARVAQQRAAALPGDAP